jgi:hypothetical protein
MLSGQGQVDGCKPLLCKGMAVPLLLCVSCADAQMGCSCRARPCQRQSMHALGIKRGRADQRSPAALAAWQSRP